MTQLKLNFGNCCSRAPDDLSGNRSGYTCDKANQDDIQSNLIANCIIVEDKNDKRGQEHRAFLLFVQLACLGSPPLGS